MLNNGLKAGTRKSWVILSGALSFLACFDNSYLMNIFSGYSKAMNLLRLLLLFSFSVRFIVGKRSYKTVTILSGILIGIIGISTLINGGNLYLAAMEFSSVVLIILCLEYVSGDENELLTLLGTWKTFFILIIGVDFLTELFFPEGLYSDRLYTINWFLGYKTQRMVYILPLISITVFSNYLRKNCLQKSTYILLLFLILDSWLSQATAASISLMILLGLILTVDNLYRKKMGGIRKILAVLLDYRLMLVLYFIIIVCIVFYENAFFMSTIAEFAGKSVTFSSRTRIWEACIEMFRQSPVWGRGYLDSSQYVLWTNMAAATNAHNAILTILMSGGWLALALYFMIYAVSLKRNREYTQCEMILGMVVYTSLILGVTSSAFIFSTYALMIYWLLEYESKKGSLKIKKVSIRCQEK